MNLRAHGLTCEYLVNPLGFDIERPRLAWKSSSTAQGVAQSAYQVQVSASPSFDDPNHWDTGQVSSGRSNQITYEGRPLEPIQTAFWRTRVWDQDGNMSPWSETAFWEAGLPDFGHWTGAQWISCPEISMSDETPPALYLRKSFLMEGRATKSRLFISAKGLYRAFLNGKRIGDDELTPGWTDYHKRIPYQAYDIAPLLRDGQNTLGIILGDGWYCGNVCWFGRRLYGSFPEALAKLYVEREDAEPVRLITDGTWKASTGAVRSNDLLMGEHHDSSNDLGPWSEAGFQDSNWKHVTVTALGQVPIVSRRCEPVRAVRKIEPVEMVQRGQKWIADMGQNMVGRLHLSGLQRSEKVQIQHAEILDKDGNLYLDNLRKAKQIDSVSYAESFEPQFTFHGFRYAEFSGASKPPKLEGVVLSSIDEPTGHFKCGNEMVNKLVDNIRWGMMGNYLEVPTDCPQRDERLGWMGDAQIFAPTAAYNFNVAAFLTKWLQDVRDAQQDDGMFTSVAPQMHNIKVGAPAWGDAGVIVPWTLYRFYGDQRILKESWHSMVRFIEAIAEANPDLIWRNKVGNNYGDWLNVDAETPKEVLATAYFAHSTSLLAKTAEVLGLEGEKVRFEKLLTSIKAAFQKAFVHSLGTIEGETQTAYVLAIRFDLLTPSQREKAAKHLIADIAKREGHLSTGFLGVGHLLPVLTEIGRDDIALKLLLNDTYPSWGYSIKQGATTIWERWDGWTEDNGFQDPGMNSFNHYALGSCGEWLYSRLAGIQLDHLVPGFKKFVLNPLLCKEIGFVESSYECPYGKIVSNWKIEGDKFKWQVEIPPNTTATLFLPDEKPREIGSGGHSFDGQA